MTILILQSGLGMYKSYKAKKVEKETKCYWHCWPYKIHKKTMKDVDGGVIVKRIFNITK